MRYDERFVADFVILARFEFKQICETGARRMPVSQSEASGRRGTGRPDFNPTKQVHKVAFLYSTLGVFCLYLLPGMKCLYVDDLKG